MFDNHIVAHYLYCCCRHIGKSIISNGNTAAREGYSALKGIEIIANIGEDIVVNSIVCSLKGFTVTACNDDAIGANVTKKAIFYDVLLSTLYVHSVRSHTAYFAFGNDAIATIL